MIFKDLLCRLFYVLGIKHCGKFNGCMYGWNYEGTPVKKLMEVWFSEESVAEEFRELCDRKHEHIAIAGKVTRGTQD